ncbi:MAG: hypothetical protein LWY06_07860 [Firmicutes bacterium]|nr:hypothetical protein [Bacillota bacterium]
MDNKNLTQAEALESLKNDFGEEGLKLLLEGADSIVDAAEKFGMPYSEIVDKIKQDEKDGKIRIVGDTMVSIEPKEKE